MIIVIVINLNLMVQISIFSEHVTDRINTWRLLMRAFNRHLQLFRTLYPKIVSILF